MYYTTGNKLIDLENNAKLIKIPVLVITLSKIPARKLHHD